jgi:hypothetical protein
MTVWLQFCSEHFEDFVPLDVAKYLLKFLRSRDGVESEDEYLDCVDVPTRSFNWFRNRKKYKDYTSIFNRV